VSTSAPHRRSWAAVAVVLAVVAFLGVAAVHVVLQRDPMSVVDEHVHYDYALRIHDGVVPYRGLVYSDALVHEWACGVGHEAGAPWTCGDPAVSVNTLPSGKYTTGYIHYPTYFVAADEFRRATAGWFGLQGDAITALRLFSVVGLVIGVLLCLASGRVVGLRGPGLVAASLAPVASSATVLMAVIINPSSFAVACGALVAATGLWWVTRGTGFWALAIAATVGALEATTSSLPGIGFGLAAAVGIWLRWRGRPVAGPWLPRVWHVVVLALITVVPVLVWGRINAARATVPNSAIYGAFPKGTFLDQLSGALVELGPHLPWVNGVQPRLVGTAAAAGATSSFQSAVTLWVGPLVGFTLLLVLIGVVPVRRLAQAGELAAAGAEGERARSSAAAQASQDEPRADEVPPDEVPSDEVDGDEVAGDELSADEPASPDRRTGRPAWSRLLADPLAVVALAQGVVLVAFPPLLRLSNTVVFGINTGIVDRYSLSLAPVLVVVTLALVQRRVFSWLLAVLSLLVTTALAVAVW
jgi:hypothetical protein